MQKYELLNDQRKDIILALLEKVWLFQYIDKAVKSSCSWVAEFLKHHWSKRIIQLLQKDKKLQNYYLRQMFMFL